MRPAEPPGARRAQTRRVLARRFSLDTGRRTLLFRGEHPARYDGHEPAPPGGPSGGDRVPGPVRPDLSNGPTWAPQGTVVAAVGSQRRRRGSMNLSPSNRLTPWVGRLIIANAVVLLLLMTVFTSPALQQSLRFAPGEALHRPWTFVTYMFVHAGLLHLLGNMLMLFVFGPPVEHRLGGRAFILYYFYCGIGAAVLSLVLSGIMPSGPFIGASGAVLGVGVAFAMLWPDAELFVFPLPTPIKARTFILVLIGLDIVLSQLTPGDGIAHLAHLGGAAFGYLF